MMNYMKWVLFAATCSISTICCKERKTVLYHSFKQTPSSYDITAWNISNPHDSTWVVKETVDEAGRVTQLLFLENGELLTDHLCYLANRVKFEYYPDSIVERLYNFAQPVLATGCEKTYQHTYHLDENGFIHSISRYAKYDFTDLAASAIRQVKNEVPRKTVQYDSSGVNLEIEYYYNSFAKRNKSYPVNKNYRFREDYYFGSAPEMASILRGLE